MALAQPDKRMLNTVKINNEITKEKFGYTQEEISNNSHKLVVVECNCCHRLIEREKRNAFKFHQCPVVEGNNKRCFSCKQWKDLTLFNKCPKLSGGVSKLCRECYNNHDAVKKCETNRRWKLKNSFNNDINSYFKRRLYQIKNNCKRNNINFDLDFSFLKTIWEDQDGKCYYSGLKLKSEGKINGFQGWLSPSLDRKTPHLGYIKDNVVWCAFGINSFKQSLNEQEFEDMVKNIHWWFE